MTVNQEYNKESPEKLRKKENLKFRTVSLYNKLKDYDFEKTLSPDYISESGITVHDIVDCLKKLEKCGSSTVIENSTEVDTFGEIKDSKKIVQSNCCHEYTICPICASAKRNKLINDLRPYIEIIREVPKIYTYIATISIKGSSSPLSDYEKLRKSWTKFTKMGQRRGDTRSRGEASKIIGSLLSIEIIPEIQDKSCFHVHGHVLLVCNKPLEYVVYDQDKKKVLHEEYGKTIPKEELNKIVKKTITIPDNSDLNDIEKEVAVSKISEEWYKASGALSFWVKPLVDRVIRGKKRPIESQLYEIIKYSTKPWEMSPMVLMEVWGALKGKRRITKSGIFTNNKRSQKEWRETLKNCDLLKKWDSIKPNEIIDIEEDKPVHVTSTYMKIIYNPKDSSFLEEKDETDYRFKEYPEYKKYQGDKARILSAYRTEVCRHILGYKIALQFGDLSYEERMEWIRKKETIKLNMRTRIYDETDLIKKFILKYQEDEEIKQRAPKIDIPKEEFPDYWEQQNFL